MGDAPTEAMFPDSETNELQDAVVDSEKDNL